MGLGSSHVDVKTQVPGGINQDGSLVMVSMEFHGMRMDYDHTLATMRINIMRLVAELIRVKAPGWEGAVTDLQCRW
jgi:hypothetical protein